MRAVVDTNVLVSGLLWHGAPHTLLEHIRDGTISLVSSPALLDELAEVIEPPPLSQPIGRDPDDDALALGMAAGADLIISGDDDLLALGFHAGIPIIDVSTALARIGETFL